MLKITILIFKDCFELAILLGIVLAITEKLYKSRFYIILGCMLGITALSLMAFFIKGLSISFYGVGDRIFDSYLILITVLMIIWLITWSNNYSSRVLKIVSSSSDKISTIRFNYLILVLTVAMFTLKEGIEILFGIFNIAYAENTETDIYLYGLGVGTISSVLAGILVYLCLIKFDNKYIFIISSILLMLISAGFSAQAAGILTSTGIITVLSDELWDTSWLINDMSIVGKSIHVILGYDARPNGMQVIFYISTIFITLIILFITKKFRLYRKD